ncbi:hypothetical protein [Rhodobacter calidifons]|uniref:Uncharacterized protein n=1 Tax=Rhodobacter calidifons TaxID=2715277 RepID=A0ABX0G2G1_9RHOB|nr:hypothetical protein [Rhodobacter calidifons]NHB75392.1 hypothetical protein [Rhodobacter calidifons]
MTDWHEQAAITLGRLRAVIRQGELRGLWFAGREVLRGLSCPVRDADWGTVPVVTSAEEVEENSYLRRFDERLGRFRGTFRVEAEAETRIRFALRLAVDRDMEVNRAGFVVLHPLAEVAGTPMTVTHSDGSRSEAAFPERIAPAQPVGGIAGIAHRVGPVSVGLTFRGDIFEMEDQRNWSDASFKTYCRPLSLPRPYVIAAGSEIVQEITLELGLAAEVPPPRPQPVAGIWRLPQVLLAHEPGLSSLRGLAAFPGVPVLLRVSAATPEVEIAALAQRADVAVEILFDDLADLDAQAGRLLHLGLRPLRVVALPRSYLASHQPEGPWPDGPAPRDAIAPLRAAFPGVPVGTGSLTNFTEFNRCPPDLSADYATFGTTAIVHAADDDSVIATREALPAIFASAKALAPGKPLHLGLFSIGMRSNPYGRSVVPNPDGLRLPMAMVDLRQRTGFAAVHAFGVLAAAARAGVESVSLAMPDGPLGAEGTPLGALIRAVAPLAGRTATWRETVSGPSMTTDGLSIRTDGPERLEVAPRLCGVP